MESPTSMYNQWTSTVTEFDVIATRGVGQNKNPGNLLFRDLVAARKSQYEKNANPEFRRNLGEEIVAAIKPGRFLKKDDITQTMYKIMDHSSAVTKASKSFHHHHLTLHTLKPQLTRFSHMR